MIIHSMVFGNFPMILW